MRRWVDNEYRDKSLSVGVQVRAPCTTSRTRTGEIGIKCILVQLLNEKVRHKKAALSSLSVYKQQKLLLQGVKPAVIRDKQHYVYAVKTLY